MWEIEVRHYGLNKYRHIRGSDRYVVEQKAAAQKLAWDEMWEKKQVARSKEEKYELAVIKTNEAKKALDGLELTLKHSLSVDNAIDWSSLLDKKPFPKIQPSTPTPETIPTEPKKSESKYQPDILLSDKISSSLRKRVQDEAESLYLKDHQEWVERKIEIESKNSGQLSKYTTDLAIWEKEKTKYEENQRTTNQYFNNESSELAIFSWTG